MSESVRCSAVVSGNLLLLTNEAHHLLSTAPLGLHQHYVHSPSPATATATVYSSPCLPT